MLSALFSRLASSSWWVRIVFTAVVVATTLGVAAAPPPGVDSSAPGWVGPSWAWVGSVPSRVADWLAFDDDFEQAGFARWSEEGSGWAFEETFDGDPASPSQDLLPRSFDYTVTHRTHARDHDPSFSPFLADHSTSCAGPNPEVTPLPQHWVATSHLSSGRQPDESFFICKNHMMSSMGDVEGYSVTSFWPRQDFDFTDGGVLEFDVNLNDDHPRSWWEVLITPREHLRVGAADSWFPIDETYPTERIVFGFMNGSQRDIRVGTGATAPEGWTVEEKDWRAWRDIDAQDPARSDQRIRRRMRIQLSPGAVPPTIQWWVEKQDGSFDEHSATVPGGFPFTRGLVVFKTHAYTPQKDGNQNTYTYHWDNLRFSGPRVGVYEAFETEELVYLEANGDREIGDSAQASIDLPEARLVRARGAGEPLVLFGQIHAAKVGHVLMSVNGGPERVVDPYEYSDRGCLTPGWSSFRLSLQPGELRGGQNEFTFRVGPRPSCLEEWEWNGFSVKGLELQVGE